MIIQTLASIVLGTASVPHTEKLAYNAGCGTATYYDNWYDGRPTSSGAIYSRYGLTAASRDFKNGTQLLVTDQDTNKSVEVEINDTGDMPFLDLSEEASIRLGKTGQPDNRYVCVQVIQ